MPVGGINEEVQGLVRTIDALGPLQFEHKLLVIFRAVLLVQFQSARIDSREQVKAGL